MRRLYHASLLDDMVFGGGGGFRGFLSFVGRTISRMTWQRCRQSRREQKNDNKTFHIKWDYRTLCYRVHPLTAGHTAFKCALRFL